MSTRTDEGPMSRREALWRKQQLAARRTWLDRLTSWPALAGAGAMLVTITLVIWLWPTDHAPANPVAMRIDSTEFPPDYLTKSDLSLRSAAIPDGNLPDQKFDPPKCAEFKSKSPFEAVGDAKVIAGTKKFDSMSDNTLSFGVVDRIASWDQFDAFVRSCPSFTYAYKLGNGSINLNAYPAPAAGADQAAGYWLEAGATNEKLSLHLSMVLLLAHVGSRTVIAGLSHRALQPTPATQLPDLDAFTKLYATLVQRVKDNS